MVSSAIRAVGLGLVVAASFQTFQTLSRPLIPIHVEVDHPTAVERDLACDKTTPITNSNTANSNHDNNSNQYFGIRDDYNISISMIVIASSTRSSSTFLSQSVLASMPCHISMDEILLGGPKFAGDAWKVEAQEMEMPKESRWNDPSKLATFVFRVGRRRCHDLLTNNNAGKNIQAGPNDGTCNNHCWINYKHFGDRLHHLSHNQMMWQSMRDQLRLQPTRPVNKHSFAMVILERPVEQRWRSEFFARSTGDWNTKGDANHKEKLQQANIPNISKSFYEQHIHWYSTIRDFSRSFQTLKKNKWTFPVIDMSYTDVTKRPANVTQQQVRDEIMMDIEAQ